jgi:NAD(P)-dependent dehydrogenase (short-subunit alcohol dehydrogenase family)
MLMSSPGVDPRTIVDRRTSLRGKGCASQPDRCLNTRRVAANPGAGPELAARGIRVNVVAPGANATDFGGGTMHDERVRGYLASQVAMGRVGEPDATVAEIERLGAKAIAVQADVSTVSDIEHPGIEAVEQFGQVDIAVANAGVEMSGIPFLETTEEQFDQLYGINAKGTGPARRS